MNKAHTIAIVQGRMSSSRLPGKVMLDIAGQPMLQRVVGRVRHATRVDEVIFATTVDTSDDPIAEYCGSHAIKVFRGDLQDVLDRYYQAARDTNAEVVVRVTGDCPVIDPGLIDATITCLLDEGVDIAATRLPPPWKRTYPIGLDVEVCRFSALEKAWKQADQKHQREHVMPYLYEGVEPVMVRQGLARGTSRHGFEVAVLHHESDLGSLRWTVDTQEDLDVLRNIYAHFDGREIFSWQEVLAMWQEQPELSQINAAVKHKSAFDVDERNR